MKDLKKIVTIDKKKEIAWRLKAGASFNVAVRLTFPNENFGSVLHFFRANYNVYTTAAVVKKITTDPKLVSE